MEPVSIKIMADTSNFDKGMSKSKVYARDTKKEIDAKTKFKMELEIVNLQNQIKKVKTLLKDKDISETKKIKLQLQANDLQRELTESKRSLNNYVNTGDTAMSRLQAKFNSVTDTIKGMANGTISAKQGMSSLASQIPAVGVAIGAIVIAVTKLIRGINNLMLISREFEDAFAGVRKTVDGTEQQLRLLEEGLEDLTKKIPLTITEIGKIAELGGQLGIPTENLLEFTEVMAQLGVTTNLTSEEASTAFAKIRNIVKEPLENLSRMGSSVVALGNNFATTEKDIINFATRIAGAGEIAGLTTPEIFAISTAFSSVGVEAESGGTSVQKILLSINNAISKGGKELKSFANVAGKTAEEFSDIWKEDAGKGFDLFIQGLGKSGEDASLILDELGFSEVRLQRAFLSLANNGSILTNAIDLSSRSWEQNNALQIEAEKRFDTNSSKMQIQSNKWKILGKTIGDFFNLIRVPVRTGITSFFTEILPTVSDNVEIFFENMFQGFVNIGKNIGKVFGNIPAVVGNMTNSVLSGIEWLINKSINGVISLTKKISKLPGLDSVFGDISNLTADISLGRVEGGTIDRTPIDNKLKAFKNINGEITNSTITASNKVKQGIQQDIEAESDALEQLMELLEDNSDSTGATLEEKLKEQLKAQRDLEIEAIKNSTDSQEEKYKKITDISEDYNKKIANIEGKTNDELIEEAEAWQKKKADLVDEAIEKADEYKEKWNEVGEKFDELVKKAKEDFAEINNDINSLDMENQIDLANRYVEVQNELNDTSDGEERLQLQKELTFLMKKTTQEQRKTAEETASLSESEKIYNEYLEERNELLEKQNIITAFTNNKDAFGDGLNISTDEKGNITGSYTDEKGELVEIKDYKNIIYAQELFDKQTALQNEYAELEKSKQEQLDLYKKTSGDIVKVREDETSAFVSELETREDEMQNFIIKAKEYLALQQELESATSGGNSIVNSNNNTTTNTKTTTINNNINNASDASAVISRLTGVGY